MTKLELPNLVEEQRMGRLLFQGPFKMRRNNLEITLNHVLNMAIN
jgi:hypothetical protein